MALVKEASETVGVSRACRVLSVSRATFHRRVSPRKARPSRPRPKSHRALSEAERGAVLEVMHSERFVDKSPATVVATLLDEGVYVCSTRTVYRILAKAGEVLERRRQARRPDYQKPELLATGPNQVWSWDITKLKGPVKWTYFYLYVMLDIFSRRVVGWMVAERENSALAQRFIDETCEKEDIVPGQLIIHSDRGTPGTSERDPQAGASRLLGQLLRDLAVARRSRRQSGLPFRLACLGLGHPLLSRVESQGCSPLGVALRNKKAPCVR
jgi:putative transposase